ncbi:MAG: demethoxyubiquinone hydroxylase family protein [Rickettsiales bacterium]
MSEHFADEKEEIAEILRVNHAGEYAAKRIYQGQLDCIKDPEAKKIIQEMADGEVEHLDYFENEIVKRKTRPTILHPLVHTIGYALGAVTAKMGTKAAMACTTAVEEVIADHYKDQIDSLNDSEKELKSKITKFREDEIGHKETALENDAEKFSAYPILSSVVKSGCKLAIRLAKRF